jgi:hypothetical protein
MRVARLPLIVFLVLNCVACSRNSQSPQPPKVEPYSITEGSIGFDIRPGGQPGGPLVASYTSRGKTATFRIELDPPKPSKNTDFPMSSGKGRFLAEPGSDPESFLADLAEVLEARKIPKKSSRSATLPFEYVILGQKQFRSKDGSFNDSPGGDWTALKLFFGDDQGEVYLNFSPTLNKAEFSIKDPDYGDFLIAEFAKVL